MANSSPTHKPSAFPQEEFKMSAITSKTNFDQKTFPDVENSFTILESAPDAWGLNDVIERIEWERNHKGAPEEKLWEWIDRAEHLYKKYDLEDKTNTSIAMTHNKSSLRWLVEWMEKEEYVDRPKKSGVRSFQDLAFNIEDWRKEDPRLKNLVQAIDHFEGSTMLGIDTNLLSSLATKISTLQNSEAVDLLKEKTIEAFKKAVKENIQFTSKCFEKYIKEDPGLVRTELFHSQRHLLALSHLFNSMTPPVETESQIKNWEKTLGKIQRALPKDPRQDFEIFGRSSRAKGVARLKENGRALGLEPLSLWQRIGKFFSSSTPSYQGASSLYPYYNTSRPMVMTGIKTTMTGPNPYRPLDPHSTRTVYR